MSRDAGRLLAALRRQARGIRRLELVALRRAHLHAFPGDAGSPEARARLAGLLTSLEREGQLVLPKGRGGWDTGAEPPLPRWLKLAATPESPSVAPTDHRRIPWAPELAFIAGLRQLTLLDEALAIQEFLVRGGRERPLVPARERSIELFGEEKRLDALRKTTLFRPGRLSLATLRCFSVPQPVVWRAGPRSARPILVVENLHTWHSLARWNQTSAAYSAVAYGAGATLPSFLPAIAEIVDDLGALALDYFGDLDASGLCIPREAGGRCRQLGLPRLRPAEPLYTLLLDRADLLQPRSPDPGTPTPADLAWLPDAVHDRYLPWARRGLRLAQELVGWEALVAG